jgi:DNA-binding GntR family transcriptional regulator
MIDEITTHHQLRKLVADKLRTAILERRFLPGEWLRQEKLAQELNVSQMPVREALKELAAEGLIEHVPYRGARVVDISPTDVEDIYSMRAFLESRAAGFAATQITPEELAELKQVQAEIEKNSAPEAVLKYRELNRRFHALIFTASRRPYLIRTLGLLWAAFPTMLLGNYPRTASQPLIGRDDVDLQEHDAIIEALEKGDAHSAQNAMKEHIESVLREMIGMINK